MVLYDRLNSTPSSGVGAVNAAATGFLLLKGMNNLVREQLFARFGLRCVLPLTEHDVATDGKCVCAKGARRS